MSKRLILNSASAAVLYAVNIVIAFIMSPVVVRALGNRDYGIWEMLLSFCGYMGILELGLGPAVIRYVAREMALQNQDSLNRVFNSAFWCLLLVGLLSLIGMCLVALIPETLLNLQPGEIESLSMLCVMAGFNLLVQFIGTLFVAFLMGRQEHFLVNMFRAFVYSAQAVLVFLALTRWEGSKLIWVAGITLAGNIFQYGVLCGLVFRREGSLSLSRSGFSYSTMKELYLFGLKSALLMVSDRIQRQSLPVIIGHTIGASSVVFFALPKRLVDYARDFVVSLGFPLMPYFSGVDALRQEGERMKEWVPVSRAVSFLTLPAAATVMALGEPFLNIWLGAEYGENGRWVVMALGASFLLTGMFSNSTRVLIAADKHGRPAKKALCISIAAVSSAIPITRWYGVTGSAVVLLAADLTACWVFWAAASKHIRITLPEHIDATVRPLLIPFLLLAGWLAAARILFVFSAYWGLATTAIIGFSLYLIAAWKFSLKKVEKDSFKIHLRNFFRKNVPPVRFSTAETKK
ncbi:MAG: oligosaccharide flippase family protein [Desulfobacterales bacterium]